MPPRNNGFLGKGLGSRAVDDLVGEVVVRVAVFGLILTDDQYHITQPSVVGQIPIGLGDLRG